MKRMLIAGILGFLSLGSYSQTEEDVANLTARVCKLTEMHEVLAVFGEDSIVSYHFLTLSFEDMGVPIYDFDGFRLVFDVGSNLMMASVPFGKIHFEEYSKNKATMVVELSGVGDRKTMGLWTYARFDFNKPKNGKWLLSGSSYSKEDYYSSKK